jgi:hypothetical protein
VTELAFPKPSRADRPKRSIDTSSLAMPRPSFDVDATFRKFVSGHACILSGSRNHECGGITEFSHLTNGGRGRKGSDYFGVPMCTNHHTAGPGAYHRLGSVEAFDQTHGTNLWRTAAEMLAEWIRRGR